MRLASLLYYSLRTMFPLLIYISVYINFLQSNRIKNLGWQLILLFPLAFWSLLMFTFRLCDSIALFFARHFRWNIKLQELLIFGKTLLRNWCRKGDNLDQCRSIIWRYESSCGVTLWIWWILCNIRIICCILNDFHRFWQHDALTYTCVFFHIFSFFLFAIHSHPF